MTQNALFVNDGAAAVGFDLAYGYWLVGRISKSDGEWNALSPRLISEFHFMGLESDAAAGGVWNGVSVGYDTPAGGALATRGGVADTPYTHCEGYEELEGVKGGANRGASGSARSEGVCRSASRRRRSGFPAGG
jgi:hypothetical protein